MIVVITKTAESDLEDIANWIARDNPNRASSFITELKSACGPLAETPRAYPIAVRMDGIEFRRRPYQDYLIFYRILRDIVEVSHIVHGARDYLKILADELK